MARERLTTKTAGDPAFGQSANDYWRLRALAAIRGALSDVEKQVMEQAQKAADYEARQLGLRAPLYAPSVAPTVPTLSEGGVAAGTGTPQAPEAEPKQSAELKAQYKDVAEKEKAMIFEPKKTASQAGTPVNPALIGVKKWREMEEKFPQYTKQPQLTMLNVVPGPLTHRGIVAFTETLDKIAEELETSGDVKNAAQLDVLSELLTASFENAVEASGKPEEKEEPKKEEEKEKK
jgi:hypothetical protein